MNKKEIIAICGIIAEVWPNTAREISDSTIGIWHEMLEDINFDIARKTIKMLALVGSPFAPTISEIRKTAFNMTGERFPTAPEAYQQATNFIGGLTFFDDSYDVDESIYIHPLAKKVLEHFGLRDFCNSNSDFARPQFIKMYESISKRAEEEASLPLDFKNEIAVLRSEEKLRLAENSEAAKMMIKELAQGKGL